MSENANGEGISSAVEAQQEALQSGDAKAEATGTAKATDALSDGDLESVAGGHWSWKGHGYPAGGSPAP
jgi:hypothetical protein